MLKRVLVAWKACAIALLFVTSLAISAETKSDRGSKLSDDDAEFVKEAAAGGMAEVELGKVAAEKGSSKQVKDFGQRMQKDHTKANAELKKLAGNKGVQLPTDLDRKHKSASERLAKLSGDEFDREYMRAMVDDHKETLEKFQRQADKGKDPDLKKFASEQLPILKKHLELAQTTQKQVAGSSKGGSPAKSAK
jgi:putative membrane protein